MKVNFVVLVLELVVCALQMLSTYLLTLCYAYVLLEFRMDKRSWPWKKKSSDKANADKVVATSDSAGAATASSEPQDQVCPSNAYFKLLIVVLVSNTRLIFHYLLNSLW